MYVSKQTKEPLLFERYSQTEDEDFVTYFET